MASNWTFNSDVLLACFFPFALFLIAFRASVAKLWTWKGIHEFLPLRSVKNFTHGPFSLQNAHRSFAQYTRLSHDEFTIRRVSYSSLNRAHKRLGNKLGYAKKLDSLTEATDSNGVVTAKIAELATKEFNIPLVSSGSGDLWRVREALKHFVRDWSLEGAPERERIFSPILDVLRGLDEDERKTRRVLVPGSGLGRLAWEISQLGYDTTANELSYFMNLAFRFLLSPDATTSINQHTLRPYAYWFSHQRSNETNFRAVPFPDAVPRLTSNFHLVEADFLTLPGPPYLGPDMSRSPTYQAGYDYIVTLFFIDTSHNVFATMEKIYALLRPGGTWINLGPLLWTSGGKAKLELSLDEVLKAAEEIGFILESGDAEDTNASRTIDCEYTADSGAMMRWIYRAEFWVARKSK